MFDRCMVRQGPRNKQHKGTCLKEIGLRLEFFIINHSMFSSEHNWEDQCIQSKNKQTRAFDIHN